MEAAGSSPFVGWAGGTSCRGMPSSPNERLLSCRGRRRKKMKAISSMMKRETVGMTAMMMKNISRGAGG